eukprot:scaffold1.g5746.t1
MVARRVLGALVCALLAAAVCAEKSKDEALINWVRSKGGVVGFTVGQECDTCIRGALASKDYEEGDLILSVPFEITIRLDDVKDGKGQAVMGFAAEYARGFLDRLHNDPSFNATYGPFIAAHPAYGESLTPEVWPEELIPELHTPALEKLVRQQLELTKEIYEGTYRWRNYTPFAAVVPPERAPLHMFQHWASLLGCRYFGFYRDGDMHVSHHLVPVVDMINHSDEPNAVRLDNSTHVLQKATRSILEGEQIFNNYQPGVIHRPDQSLYIYGFVAGGVAPLLAAVDLPFYKPDAPFEKTPEDDVFYGDEALGYATPEEHDRLKGLLAEAEAKATLLADEDALAADAFDDWRLRTIVQYRAARKRALRRVIAKLAERLGIDEEDAEEQLAELDLGRGAEGEGGEGGAPSGRDELRR